MQHARVHTIYTLGPEGTNCAAAAQWWFDFQQSKNHLDAGVQPRIVLHPTLEQAFEELSQKRDGYLLSCAAYPDLHPAGVDVAV